MDWTWTRTLLIAGVCQAVVRVVVDLYLKPFSGWSLVPTVILYAVPLLLVGVAIDLVAHARRRLRRRRSQAIAEGTLSPPR